MISHRKISSSVLITQSIAILITILFNNTPALAQMPWYGYAGNPQHTAKSKFAAQHFKKIKWQTPVDLTPQSSFGDLLIHYGSPMITPHNTVIIPVKTGQFDGFKIEARKTKDGSLVWTQNTSYSVPQHDWTPSFSPTITPKFLIYYPESGGRVSFRDNLDAPNPLHTSTIAFYGAAAYAANPSAYDANVKINTPITTDSQGNIYFGYYVTGATPIGLTSGIVRIGVDGKILWTTVISASGDSSMTKVVHNCAPALSVSEGTLYVAVSNGNGFGFGTGYLLALNSKTLAPKNAVRLKDPRTFQDADLHDDGTSSPTVGPDGDVYMGVLENPFASNNDRGWLLHFDSTLATEKTPGAFGWDDTCAIVPSSMVSAYHGSSTYLIMTKYNNYAGLGSGDGVNRVAILDSKGKSKDPVTGIDILPEVISITGQTPDLNAIAGGYPNAVREWCINTAAVDTVSKSIIVNSEDGVLYRWSTITGNISESIRLTAGLGEAYTPTLIAPDGTVFAINDAMLFAVGE